MITYDAFDPSRHLGLYHYLIPTSAKPFHLAKHQLFNVSSSYLLYSLNSAFVQDPLYDLSPLAHVVLDRT